MKNKSILITITFVISLMLEILPLPAWAVWLRPGWTLLVLIFWVMMLPERISVGVAFFLGLTLDLLNGTLLGEHALPMVIIAYFVSRYSRRIQLFPMQQQMVVVGLFVFIYKLFIFTVQGFVNESPSDILYWLSILVSILLWPWVSLLLQGWFRRSVISR